jgi:TonB-dependent SusC/RagA subfamily outer membrane receptor
VSVRIIGAVLGESDPLFVIDGTPVTVKRGKLDWLSPEDITGIRVLKYPTATAQYGPRAVNGVVVITTRWSIERPEW